MNTLAYKGFFARVELDVDDGIFVGHLAGINDVVGFHADNVGDLIRAFHDAVDDYVTTCQAVGKPAEKPYSGKLMLRVKPEVHAQAALAAQLAGKSMNQWSEEALTEAAHSVVPSELLTRPSEVVEARKKYSTQAKPKERKQPVVEMRLTGS